MRPIAAIASTVLLLLWSTPVSCSDEPSSLSISLVDLLANSSSHSLLLQAFQRARLIPLLNEHNASESGPLILFAPTNDAISHWKDTGDPDGVWNYATADSAVERDNLQLKLRLSLLYHLSVSNLFNATLPTAPLLLETLYHPSNSAYNASFPEPPSLPGSPPNPHTPPNEGQGLLRGHGQRVRIVDKDSELWLGGDWRGEGGLKVKKGSQKYARDGILVELEGVLQRPHDLTRQIEMRPDLSIFVSLLPRDILDYLRTAAHVSLFAPTNAAFAVLDDLQMRYLRSGFAEKDLTILFGGVTSLKGKIAYLGDLLNGTSVADVSTIIGSTLKINGNDAGDFMVNGTAVETGDILAKNGVMHTVPSLLLPSGALSLTAEKYLIALNATRFVSLLRSVNLSHYVQLPSSDSPFFADHNRPAFTILAPRDDAFDFDEWTTLPPEGSEALRQILEYHIIAGKWTPSDLVDGQLIGTELRGDARAGARQMLPVSVTHEDGDGHKKPLSALSKLFGVQSTTKGPSAEGVVGFNGASVLGKPIQVGDSIIYLLASVLEPPTSLINTAVSDLRLSTYVASVYAASLDRLLSRAAAITYLIPSNVAFARLGLVMKYLLLPTSREELRSVLLYHAIDEISYIDDFSRGSRRFPTLDGAEIYGERANKSILFHGPTVGGTPLNGEQRDAKVLEGNILVATGVIHVIDQVELPPHLDISIGKLMKAAKANTMDELIRVANMSWVLERGFKKPAEEETGKNRKQRKEKSAQLNVAYTILCPSDKAFSKINLTYYLDPPNLSELRDLIKLHIIPTDAFSILAGLGGQPLLLQDDATYSTLLDVSQGGLSQYGQLAFRQWGADGFLVGIKDARGERNEFARVIDWGRASPWLAPGHSSRSNNVSISRSGRLAAGGGVVTIDSVIIPFAPSFFARVGWIIVATLIVLALTAGVVLMVWKLYDRKPRYEALLENEED